MTLPTSFFRNSPVKTSPQQSKVQFCPRKCNGKVETGERAGIAVMGYNYGALALEAVPTASYLTEVGAERVATRGNKGGMKSGR